MPDWSQFEHAFGPAEDIPGLLTQLAPDPEAEVWEQLWSSLCHQGSVYSASFATLPALENAARQWHPRERGQPLMLAACIVGATDGEREPRLRGLGLTLDSLRTLTRESLAAPGWSNDEFILLMQAALALAGDAFWGSELDHLADGEFPGVCPRCKTDNWLLHLFGTSHCPVCRREFSIQEAIH